MLNHFPTTIKAGVSLRATITSDDYPAPDWSVVAYLRGPKAIDLVAVADGADHKVSETGANTVAYDAGRYTVTVRAEKDGDVFEIESGEVEILADVASLNAGHDPRKHAEKVLEAIEAVIERRATKDQQSYTINGRTLVRTSIDELLKLRKTYRLEVAKLNSNGRHKKLVRRQVRVRF